MPSSLGIVASGIFTPLDLSPALWLDASDASTITASSGKVSQWNDKSKNGRNATQSTGTKQFTTGTVTKNGRNVLVGAAGTSMITPSWTPPASNFAAYAVASTGSTAQMFIFEQSTTTAGRRYLWRNTSNKAVFGYNDGTTFRDYFSNTWTYSAGSYYIFGGRTASSDVTVSVSGIASLTTTRTGFPTAVSKPTTIGADQTAGIFPWIGNLCEILIFDVALDANQEATLYAYLNAKWAVY